MKNSVHSLSLFALFSVCTVSVHSRLDAIDFSHVVPKVLSDVAEQIKPTLNEFLLWHAGMESQKFAKALGNYVAVHNSTLELSPKKTTTAVAKQDFKFVFASVLQSYFSYFYPELKQQRPHVALGLPRSISQMALSNARPLSPGPSQGRATPGIVDPIRPDTSAVPREIPEGIDQPARQLNADEHVTSIFKAGMKYVAASELVEKLGELFEEWEELHSLAPIDGDCSAATNGTLALPSTDELTDPSLPIIWYHWIEAKAAAAEHFFESIWQDKGLAMFVAIQMATVYHITRFTMIAPRLFRDQVLVNRGYAFFKDNPWKQVVEISLGVMMSFGIKNFVSMPVLHAAAQFLGIDDSRATELLETSYMTGIKGPFARDAFVDTYEAGGMIFSAPMIFLGAFLALKYLVPQFNGLIPSVALIPALTEYISGLIYAAQIGWVYWTWYSAQGRARPHSHHA